MRHFKQKSKISRTDRGAAMMIFTIFVFFTSFIIIVGISRPALREFAITQNAFNSRQTYFTSESGVEDAFYRIKKGRQLSASETLVLGSSSATTTISDINANQKQISSLATTSSHQRKVNLVLDIIHDNSSVVALDYPVHIGTGGMKLVSGSTFEGDVYSRGSIVSEVGTSTINGSAFSNGSSGLIGSGPNFGGSLTITGNASAHNVDHSTVTGTIYCQSGSNNNKSCNTSQADPTISNLVDFSSRVSDWKNQAVNGGVTTGNVSVNNTNLVSLGPQKIVGDLTVYGGGVLTLTGPVWVTGNISMISNGAKIKIDSTFGNAEVPIISDKNIELGGNSTFEGSGVSGSYVFVVSTSTSPSPMYINNVSGDALYYAPNGEVIVSSSQAQTKGILAKSLQIAGGTSNKLKYVTGPMSLNFTPDTYSINSWKESQ